MGKAFIKINCSGELEGTDSREDKRGRFKRNFFLRYRRSEDKATEV